MSDLSHPVWGFPDPTRWPNSWWCGMGWECAATKVRHLYWVPMAEYEDGPAWRWIGRGATPDEAREVALDAYEDAHAFRPLPNGTPERIECAECGRPFPAEYGKFDPRAPVYADEGTYHLECEAGQWDEVYCEVGQ